MEVDHHNPKAKRRHAANNLLPACRHCNGSKSDTWPTPAQHRQGIRFLNPTVEQDYGQHIFEDPDTHELVGVTPSGKYHITMLDLNDPHFVQQRKDRSELRALLEDQPVTVRGDFITVKQSIAALREHVARMIPVIPPPPSAKA